jgi:hypothetical protein
MTSDQGESPIGPDVAIGEPAGVDRFAKRYVTSRRRKPRRCALSTPAENWAFRTFGRGGFCVKRIAVKMF